MNGQDCFLNKTRACSDTCVAYVSMGGTTKCRLLNTFEKLIPIQPRPSAPPAPAPKVKT